MGAGGSNPLSPTSYFEGLVGIGVSTLAPSWLPGDGWENTMISYQSAMDWRWVIEAEEVQFTAAHSGKEILCRVTRECIEDHCGKV